MEIKGKIIAVLNAREGESSRGKWKIQEYVVQEEKDDYPQSMCFQVFGEDKIEKFGIGLGDLVTVKFNVECRNYNGRWYNTLSAWSVVKEGFGSYNNNQGGEQPKQQGQPAPKADINDLPF